MTDNPIVEYEHRDTYFDTEEAQALYDAYMILYDYGYSHEDLAPLYHLMVATTHMDGYGLRANAEEMVSEE